jgi:hypothetical protein
MIAANSSATVQKRLSRAFQANEVRLAAELARARATMDHATSKGDILEAAARSFLRAHLPSRLNVGQGEVIDLRGERSRQVDVIITDEDHPFVFPPAEPGVHLVEGVAAGGEIKAALTTSNLDDIILKGLKFKRLRPNFSPGDTILANDSDRARFYTSRPFFALAFEKQASVEAINDRLLNCPTFKMSHEEQMIYPLDALFVLNHGSYINFHDGAGAFQFRSEEALEHSRAGWQFISHKQSPVLMQLFLWLHAVMPRIHRFSNISTLYLNQIIRS